MEIKPNEVEEVKVIGKLNGDDVKLVKTHGGFHIAMGKKDKKSNKAEALAAGSHQALVAYQIEKMHGQDFEPTMFKSEAERLPKVEDKSDMLPDMAKNAGLEVYILSKFNHVDFVICKNNVELAKYETEHSGQEMTVKDYSFRSSLSPNKFVSQVLAKAIDEKMKELGLTKVNQK